jgi:hypothetical protein
VPPGIDPEQFALALVEDTYEVLHDLVDVEVVVALPPDEGWSRQMVGRLWPGAATLLLPAGPVGGGGPDRAGGPDDAGGAADAAAGDGAALSVLHRLGAERSPPSVGDQVVVVAADVPDLPGLVVAKCFAALEDVSVAAVPALRGGLVALGSRLPVPEWLLACGVDLDTDDAVARLRSAAPRRSFVATPPWRRLREPSDIASLDPGLEGWEATRALLSGAS